MSNEKFTCAHVANVSFCPKVVCMNYTRIRLKFKGSCLKQEDTAPFTPNNVVSLFIVYELDSFLSYLNSDFTLGGCLFESAINWKCWSRKYSYSGYGLQFSTHGYHSLPDVGVGKNVIIFGFQMSSSVDFNKWAHLCTLIITQKIS